MNNRELDTAQRLNHETIESLKELTQALRDSVNYHTEAADAIDDGYVKGEFQAIATERKDICDTIGGFVAVAQDKSEITSDEEGTFLGSLRTIWTSFRAGLNSGDATIVLIEAERAEDVIVNKFKDTLPKIAGNPVNDKLLKNFETIKAGHDRILALRNAYQNA